MLQQQLFQFLSITLLISLFQTGCEQPAAQPTIVTLSGETMGTTWSVKIADLPSSTEKEVIKEEIDQLLETINDQMSTYRPNSELSLFNTQQKTDWFTVSPETASVVSEALRISEISNGAFDVTVGPLVNLWHFGPDKSAPEIPSDELIESTQEKVGFQNIEVRTTPSALKKSRGDEYVDLSAIAKGYGVDKVAEYLDSLKSMGYLVEIGGEMRSSGTKPNSENWVVGIESPVENERSIQKIIQLHNQSLATSGDYRNYFELDGQRYSHTIDPRTGRPATHQLAAVSVVAEKCMVADALATAIMVLGPEEGYNFAVEQKVEALFFIRDKNSFIEKQTPAFANLIKTNQTTP